jgi:hypothetical protein
MAEVSDLSIPRGWRMGLRSDQGRTGSGIHTPEVDLVLFLLFIAVLLH